MRSAQSNQLPEPLRRAAERFEQWRRLRVRRAPIPETLWTLAANLAARYGVWRTASTLNLDYYSLKGRLPQCATAAAQSGVGQAAFLELPASALPALGECVIECENSSGARMRICLKGVALSDLAALGRSFWGGE
jgi:hypothetical protein